jgi:hypothetical protein
MEMCAEVLDREAISKSSRDRGCSPVYLSIPSILSEFRWRGGSLEALTKKLLEHVLSLSQPARGVRVAVHERKRMSDLEEFFAISPLYWFQLSVECQAHSDLSAGAQRVLESLGYSCLEWIGVEGSESQLGAFSLGTPETPSLILYLQNHGARRICDILIPVIESESCLDHAV